MEQLSHRNFTDLQVCKKGREIKKESEALTKNFPAEEKCRSTDQIIRPARSVNSNIAEGHGRFPYKNQLHFCIQARGALSETLNDPIDVFDCAYITQEQLQYYKTKGDEAGKFLNGYNTYLRKNL